MTGGAQLQVGTQGLGNAGNITIAVGDTITIAGEDDFGFPSGIFTQVAPDAGGETGEILIHTSTLSLTNGGQISAITLGQGDAGAIQIIATDSVTLSGESTQGAPSAIASQVLEGSSGQSGSILIDTTKLTINGGSIGSNTQGDGREIILNTQQLFLDNNAEISSKSYGAGDAGNITILAGELLLNNGTISAQTTSNTGGNITLQIDDTLTLRHGSQISTTAGNQQQGGDGGNIQIVARFIFAIPEENSDITANAFTGRGGRIAITTEALIGIQPRDFPTFLSDITASSELGVDGTIEINRLNVDPTEGLTNLPSTPAEVKVAQGCDVGGKGSISFYDLGRGGLPAQPGDYLTIDSIITPWIPLTTGAETEPKSWQLRETTYSGFSAPTYPFSAITNIS